MRILIIGAGVLGSNLAHSIKKGNDVTILARGNTYETLKNNGLVIKHKLGKKTEDLFILDFFNNVDDIKAAFDPFYTSTSLSGATDVNVLHELKSSLDEVAVYEWDEVEEFQKVL